jgi:hypothetical protein
MEYISNWSRKTERSQHVTSWIWNTKILTDNAKKFPRTLF